MEFRILRNMHITKRISFKVIVFMTNIFTSKQNLNYIFLKFMYIYIYFFYYRFANKLKYFKLTLVFINSTEYLFL